MNRITLKNPLNHPLNLLTEGNKGWKKREFYFNRRNSERQDAEPKRGKVPKRPKERKRKKNENPDEGARKNSSQGGKKRKPENVGISSHRNA